VRQNTRKAGIEPPWIWKVTYHDMGMTMANLLSQDLRGLPADKVYEFMLSRGDPDHRGVARRQSTRDQVTE